MSISSVVPGLLAIVRRELAVAEPSAQDADVSSALLSELHLGWLSAHLNRLLVAVGSNEIEDLRGTVRNRLARFPRVRMTEDLLKATYENACAAAAAPTARIAHASDAPFSATADVVLLGLSFLVRRTALDATICRLHGDSAAVLQCDLQLRWLMGYLAEVRIVAREQRIASGAEVLRAQASAEVRDLRARPSCELLAEGLARTRRWSAVTPPADAANLLLTDVDLSDLALSQIRLHNTKLFHANLSGADLTSVQASGASVVSSSLGGAVLTFGSLDRAFIRDCSFGRAQLNNADWRKATILSSSFDEATFAESSLDEVVFQNCSLVETSFTLSPNAMVAERIAFRGCDLTRSIWTGRNLSNVRFEGCHMSGMAVGPAIRDAVIERPSIDGRAVTKAEVVSALDSSALASRKGLSQS